MSPRGTRIRRILGVALVCSATLVAVATPANAAPSITVTPGGPYANGAQVSVTAEGFSPGAFVLVAQCKGPAPVTDPRACAVPSTGASVVASADPTGKVTAALKVVTGELRPGVSCAGAECLITALNVGSPTTENASVPLGSTTGSGTSAPPPGASPSTSNSAPVAGATTPAVSPTPTPVVPSPTPTPVATANNAPAAPPAKVRTALPKTGPEDATYSLLAGVVILQLGLIAVVRINRKRRPRA